MTIQCKKCNFAMHVFVLIIMEDILEITEFIYVNKKCTSLNSLVYSKPDVMFQ
jgi:hypothetical protein